MHNKTFRVDELMTDKGTHAVYVYEPRKTRMVYVPSSDLNGFINCLLFLGFKKENIPS